jgi:hypothetical protein
MTSPTKDFQSLLEKVQLSTEDLAEASGSCIEEVQAWIDGATIPDTEGKRLAQLGILVSCLVQMMPPEDVRTWLYQEIHGSEHIHALKAISKERGEEVIKQLQDLYPDSF